MQPTSTSCTTTSRVTLVTGASRGVGADVAHRLAAPNRHVIVNYREQTEQAESVAEAIRAAGGHASTVRADIADARATVAMIDEVESRFGRLDSLVLNASGGLERGADTNEAMRVNHDAQQRLAQLALPLMPVGANLVFVTSHQAHFYPNKAVPKGYATLAASQHAGETALYAMRSQFDRRGVRFSVVSGDMIEDVIEDAVVVDLLARRHRAPRRSGTEFAGVIARAASTPDPAGIIYVGGPEHLRRKTA